MQYTTDQLAMTISSKLPTAEDINVYGSPDEASACEHFLHKTLAEAEGLFRENSAYYQEDLMWMGPKAFQFYLQSVIQYLHSPDAAEDDHFIDCLYEIVMFRMNQAGFSLATDRVVQMIDYILNHFEKFKVDPEIYGDLRGKYTTLQRQISTSG